MANTNSKYRRYLLMVLVAIVTFNLMDRVALGLLLQDIKADLALSDTQLGFLGGIAFALFYSVMGIPIARWADRGHRVAIISLTATLSGLMVALCGIAGSFVQLLAIRTGVAVGEAGCIPPAHSLIADYFARSERPRAAAIYALGGPLSLVAGYFFAGWLNELYGWRATFMWLGMPSLVMGMMAALSLREPRRAKPALQIQRSPEIASSVSPNFKEVCGALASNRTFRHLVLGFSVMFFFGYGLLQWQPAFFVRSYGVHTGALGTWLAVIYGVGGLVGTYLGGALASRYAANRESLQLKVLALVISCVGVISTFVYLLNSLYWAFVILIVFSLGYFSVSGPLLATIQTLVPERMRATAIALIYLFSNLIGMGLGPLAAGALSDALHPWAGVESLRYALLAFSPGYLWVAWHFWRASRTVAEDIAPEHHAEWRSVAPSEAAASLR